jgi:fructose-bisphosphate aldolase class I
MMVAGKHCSHQPGVDEVAAATLSCFERCVPSEVPGIIFLSGGQSEEVASERLNAICTLPHPAWAITFSFGRALQDSALRGWRGLAKNIPEAQRALLQRAHANSLAVRGAYDHAEQGAL